jgi:hypothetical protein
LTNLLEATTVQVTQYGELVELAIGPEKWSMPFDVALSLAHALLTEGRVARKAAGYKGTNLRSSGLFTAEDKPKFRQNRWQRIAAQLTKHRMHVQADGSNVDVTLGHSRYGVPFDAALTISQWLRIHGRAARNEAGEKASWVKIATA